ncbi:Alpha/Beta hydrolase protein [Polychytrium aggregatum]|uniref:Alpha/Beta hydrolase protein n=1 Tax=Polychytrium aggregatum TaxID=110093 RepID=UPI0022FEC68A|nr:Alpha/Beta hydrolase protein [Polychytrium aggregatum]KAI9207797.1 Alpha/Beta hydrolase protein [Polychytrium aggregatum]
MRVLLATVLSLVGAAWGLAVQQQPINLINEPADLSAWSVVSSQDLPGYSIRLKESSRLCDPDVKQIHGYLDIENRHLFFWFFESRSSPATDPVTLWLNGGPGCSSMLGLLMELGPCRVAEAGNTTDINPHSWNTQSNVLFLDQPAGVGLSYYDNGTKIPHTTPTAAADVLAFLKLFFGQYGEYSELPFHIFGESYGGHYVPAIAHAIWKDNAVAERKIPLTSIGIGNGLTDSAVQFEHYHTYGCKNPKYKNVFSQKTCDDLAHKIPTCKELIDTCQQWRTPFTCVPASVYCNEAVMKPFQETGLNVYDIRRKCESGSDLCYPIINDVQAYLNTPEVRAQLGVSDQAGKFQTCSNNVGRQFSVTGDLEISFGPQLAELLDNGIKALIYVGDADFICNWMGVRALTLALEWSGSKGFNRAKDLHWLSSQTGKLVGDFRTYKTLTYLRVNNAGHMVPYDQPSNSLEMFNLFISPDYDSFVASALAGAQ